MFRATRRTPLPVGPYRPHDLRRTGPLSRILLSFLDDTDRGIRPPAKVRGVLLDSGFWILTSEFLVIQRLASCRCMTAPNSFFTFSMVSKSLSAEARARYFSKLARARA